MSKWVDSSPFKTKRFQIHHSQCAMKVTTEACLFGAVIQCSKAKNVLDIGAGSGVLSLFMAQRSNCIIDALEIDEASYRQCKLNFQLSPWSDRLSAHLVDARTFGSSQYYDVIVSNPPFYEGDLKSGNSHKNKAKHDLSFNLEHLFTLIRKSLNHEGSCWVLYPENRIELLIGKALEKGLFINSILRISSVEDQEPFRSIVSFSRFHNDKVTEESINICNQEGNYSSKFRDYLHPYYIIFE